MSVLVLNCQIKRLKLHQRLFLLLIDLKIFTINRLIIHYIKCLKIVKKVFNFLLLSGQPSKNSKSLNSLSELRKKGSKSSHLRSWRRTVFEILVWIRFISQFSWFWVFKSELNGSVPDRSRFLPPGILHRSSSWRCSPGKPPAGCRSWWRAAAPSLSAGPHWSLLETCQLSHYSPFHMRTGVSWCHVHTFFFSRSPAWDPAHGALLKLLPVVGQTDGLHEAYGGESQWTTTPRVSDSFIINERD